MYELLVSDREMSTRDWALDAVIAALMFVVGCVQLALGNIAFVVSDEEFRTLIGVVNVAPRLSSYVLVALTTLPLALRRRFTVPVLVFTFICYLVALMHSSAYTLSFLGPMVALFTVAYERSTFEAVLAGVLCAVSVLLVEMPFGLNESMVTLSRIQNVSYIAVAVAVGIALSVYKSYVVASEERALASKAQQEEEASRRIQEERLAIAREIHDITAHSLTAVSIQAAAAEKMLVRNPEAARDTIIQVRDISKNALEEIRSMVKVLRNEDQDAETAPTLGTDRLEDVVEYAREAGLQAELDCSAYRKEKVPAYVDVALFGIVREAVTNTVRHAQACKVHIRLSTDSKYAYAVVEDDGAGMKTVRPGGHGLMGMEERVRVLHGTFSASNRPQGGFRVEARVPFAEGE